MQVVTWKTPIRRERLERMVRIASGKKHINLVFTRYMGAYRVANTIHIGTKPIPNKILSNISFDLWMLIAQRALAMHELGHILWSNWNELKRQYEKLRELSVSLAEIYKEVGNIIEDARVDRMIAKEFPGAGFYIRKLRENFGKISREKLERGEVNARDPLIQYFLFLHNTLIYDSGNFKWVVENFGLNPITERMIRETSELVKQAMEEPDPRKVHRYYRDIAIKIYDILTEESGDVNLSFLQDLSSSSGVHHPNTCRGSHLRQCKIEINIDLEKKLEETLNEVEQEQQEQDKEEVVEEEQKDEEEVELEPKTESNQKSASKSEMEVDSENGEKVGSGSPSDLPENEEEILKELEKELAQEVREINEMLGTRRAYDTSTDNKYYSIPIIYAQPDYDTWKRFSEEKIKSIGNIIARNLLTMLRERVKSKYKPGFKSGRLHTKSLWKLSKNDYRVFKRKEEEKELNYQCFILLDRSGSMYGDKIYKAVYATLILCYALEKVGIQTEVVGFNDHELTVHKQLEEKIEYAKYKIANFKASGWTPTHIALHTVKERIRKLATKKPFIIIVTDGCPDSIDDTIEEIKTCPYPVVGVTIGLPSFDWEKIYHAEVRVKSVDDLLPALTHLVKKLMF